MWIYELPLDRLFRMLAYTKTSAQSNKSRGMRNQVNTRTYKTLRQDVKRQSCHLVASNALVYCDNTDDEVRNGKDGGGWDLMDVCCVPV